MSQESSTEIHRYGVPARFSGRRAVPESPSIQTSDLPTTASRRLSMDAPYPPQSGIPIVATLTAPMSSKAVAPNAAAPRPLLRQIRARLAFERTSTRLYEAFLAKLDVPANTMAATPRTWHCAIDRETLMRFRNEEAAHFELLCEALESMGADPLAELDAAGADARATADPDMLSSGRLDTGQALAVLLDAEQADEAGWRRLVATAHDAGMDELALRFKQAHGEELVHVRQLRAWQIALRDVRRCVA